MRRLEALKSGEIKGTAINEPVASLAREAGLTALVDLVAEKIPWLFSSIVVKASSLQSHRDVTMRFLKASSHRGRSEEHTSELQSHSDLVCRLLLEKKKNLSTRSRM